LRFRSPRRPGLVSFVKRQQGSFLDGPQRMVGHFVLLLGIEVHQLGRLLLFLQFVNAFGHSERRRRSETRVSMKSRRRITRAKKTAWRRARKMYRRIQNGTKRLSVHRLNVFGFPDVSRGTKYDAERKPSTRNVIDANASIRYTVKRNENP